MMKNVLVFDKKKYLYRFIKTSYEKNGQFKITKFDPKIRNISIFDYFIFVYYDESDIILFTDLYLKYSQIILLYEEIDLIKTIQEKCSFINCINVKKQKKDILTNLKWIIN